MYSESKQVHLVYSDHSGILWFIQSIKNSTKYKKALDYIYILGFNEESHFVSRDHILQKLLPLIASSPVTDQMYEENSFLRNYSHINYLVHILSTLEEFQITLESSLLRGLEI